MTLRCKRNDMVLLGIIVQKKKKKKNLQKSLESGNSLNLFLSDFVW